MESCCDCCCCLDVEPTSVATCKRYVRPMETLCRDWQCSRLCQRWRISLWKTSSSNADRFINCFYEVFSISYMVLYRCLISQAHAKEILLSSQKSRVVELPPPLLFGLICFVVLVMRTGGESSWSGPWHIRCTLEVFRVHSYQDQFIQPGWAECVFCVHIYHRFVLCMFICPFWFVCIPILLCFPEQLSRLPCSFWR